MGNIKDILQLVVQCGALGLLLVLFWGAFKAALVYAPLVKDFLVGLIQAQGAIQQQQAALAVRLDELRGAVTRLEADGRRAAEELERAIERARDDVLVELGGGWTRPASSSRPSAAGPAPSRRVSGGA